jgi:hypothetical protein
MPVVAVMAVPDVNRYGASRRGRGAEQTQRENGRNQCFHVLPLGF